LSLEATSATRFLCDNRVDIVDTTTTLVAKFLGYLH
jgi:hypothetical protein